jgi:hypothetical protein
MKSVDLVVSNAFVKRKHMYLSKLLFMCSLYVVSILFLGVEVWFLLYQFCFFVSLSFQIGWRLEFMCCCLWSFSFLHAVPLLRNAQ